MLISSPKTYIDFSLPSWMASIIWWLLRPGFGGRVTPQAVSNLLRISGSSTILIAGEEVGHGAVVAGALHVVVSAQRVGAGAGAHVVAGDQQQVRDGGRGVGAHGVLGDAHGPEDADASRHPAIMCATCFRVSTGMPQRWRGHFQRERLKALGCIHQAR